MKPFLAFPCNEETFLASCITVVPNNMKLADASHFLPQRRESKSKKIQNPIGEIQVDAKENDSILDLCYAVLKTFPNGGDKLSTVTEVFRRHCYGIRNNGGRPCPFGTHHQSNGGYLIPKMDEDEAGFNYRCHSPRCRGQELFFKCKEVRPLLEGVRCLPPRTLEKYDRIESKIFKEQTRRINCRP